MTDEEIEAALTDVPGIGPWTARGFLLVALDRPDVFLSGDLALRRTIQRGTHSTTCQPTRSWSSSRTAGGRTGAWPSATCSRRNMGESSERDWRGTRPCRVSRTTLEASHVTQELEGGGGVACAHGRRVDRRAPRARPDPHDQPARAPQRHDSRRHQGAHRRRHRGRRGPKPGSWSSPGRRRRSAPAATCVSG